MTKILTSENQGYIHTTLISHLNNKISGLKPFLWHSCDNSRLWNFCPFFIIIFLSRIIYNLCTYFQYAISWFDLYLCFDWKRPCRISVSISSSFQNVQKRRGIETRGGGESAESSPPPPPVPSRAGQPPPPGPGIGSSALGGAQGLQVKIWEIFKYSW